MYPRRTISHIPSKTPTVERRWNQMPMTVWNHAGCKEAAGGAARLSAVTAAPSPQLGPTDGGSVHFWKRPPMGIFKPQDLKTNAEFPECPAASHFNGGRITAHGSGHEGDFKGETEQHDNRNGLWRGLESLNNVVAIVGIVALGGRGWGRNLSSGGFDPTRTNRRRL